MSGSASGSADGRRHTRAEIRRAIERVAHRFGASARDTILYEKGLKQLREVRSMAAVGRDVIDLGGGLGVNLLVLRELGHAGRLVLVDRFEEFDDRNRMGPRQEAFPLLREAGVEIVEMDFWPTIDLPFEGAAFDVACCYDVIEHLPGHPLRQLAELHRVLRPGGSCLISGPNAGSLMKHVKLAIGRHPYAEYSDWVQDRFFGHYREYFRAEYEDLLRRSGFTGVESEASAVITVNRVRRRYHRRRRGVLSPVTLALAAVAGVELTAPPLRHTIYAHGRKPTREDAADA